jgi:DNA mismatch repair protein MutS2
MKMKVNLKQVRRTNADKKKSFTSSRAFKSRSANISTSIDLRGSNYEDAIYELDRYLDDVAMSGIDQVTIIHGVGTGVLKSKLKGYFSKHPHIETFREGEYGEGGAGVTIVKVNK